jgi:hypothetical protein
MRLRRSKARVVVDVRRRKPASGLNVIHGASGRSVRHPSIPNATNESYLLRCDIVGYVLPRDPLPSWHYPPLDLNNTDTVHREPLSSFPSLGTRSSFKTHYLTGASGSSIIKIFSLS